MKDGISMAATTNLPPFDSRALDFDISHETRRTVVDLMRGQSPSTILGVLLTHAKDGISVTSLADHLQQPAGLISWYVEKLEAEDLCVRSEIEGDIRVLPLAAYTVRNE